MRYEFKWIGVADHEATVVGFDKSEDILNFFQKLNWVENIIEFSERYHTGKSSNDDWGATILDKQLESSLSFYLIDLIKPGPDLALDRLNFYATYKREVIEKNSWLKRLFSSEEYSTYTLETEAEQISYKTVIEILNHFLNANFMEVSKIVSSPIGFGSIH